MPSLTVIKSGLLTTIQDLGRRGFGYYAIPQSGVMDTNAAKIALLLLFKNETDPLIECTSIAPHLQFHTATEIALTGADFGWTINNILVNRNTVLEIKKGDVLKGKFAKNGLRGYIAINGELAIEEVYQSYATYTNAKIGGFHGRLLKKQDVLEWAAPRVNFFKKNIIPIHKGPEYDLLTSNAKTQLLHATYKISADSNRMGVRLVGERLDCTTYQLEYSLPILPGFIQLPPSGQPIIILQDGQISGGYPRIAYIREQYLAIINQIPLGGRLQFLLE